MSAARRIGAALATMCLAHVLAVPAAAQFGYATTTFDLSPDVTVDEARAEARTLRDQARAFLAENRHDEAIDHLLTLIREHGHKLVPVTKDRYVNLTTECQLQLIALPPEAATAYRQRVDADAQRLVRQGREHHDRAALVEVATTMLASSWADEALWTLGEWSLSEGDFASARRALEQLIPNPPDLPAGHKLTRLAHPNPGYPVETVLARLALVSILEGDAPRAQRELAAFREQFPQARGRMAGRDVVLADHLDGLLAAQRDWSGPAPTAEWTTYAGNPQRAANWPLSLDLGSLAWKLPLPQAAVTTPNDTRTAPGLGCFPIVIGGVVFVADSTRVLAADARTGRPAWGEQYEIHVDSQSARSTSTRSGVGVERHTLSAYGSRLFARLGTVETTQFADMFQRTPGYLVCLDLKAQGRLLWKIVPEEPGFAIEGPPVCDGQRVFVVLRRSDVRPQSHVACYDAQSGQLQWRQFVCGAETPARGQMDEITHSLLTLDHDTLYLATQLGAVAALSVDDGRLRWLYRYPRTTSGDLSQTPPHYERDLNPCLLAGGMLFVAPADGLGILALDPGSGQLQWESRDVVAVKHLLGVVNGKLLAGGDHLWWLDASSGRVERWWPDGSLPKGYGRGLIAGRQVLWPTRDHLYVFDAETGQPLRTLGLQTPESGLSGGNLIPAPGHLLIATDREVVALSAGELLPPPRVARRDSSNPSEK